MSVIIRSSHLSSLSSKECEAYGLEYESVHISWIKSFKSDEEETKALKAVIALVKENIVAGLPESTGFSQHGALCITMYEKMVASAKSS